LIGANVRHAALTVVLAVSAGAIAACSGGAASPDLISVTTGGCGTSWQPPSPGWHTFQIHNAASQNADVDLINPGNGAIYAEVEALGPGTTSVSHQLTNTASIIKFAENNWLGGKRIGGGSFDASSNSLSGMLQFFAPRFRPVILDPATGAVARK
jgi:hypothetical protein